MHRGHWAFCVCWNLQREGSNELRHSASSSRGAENQGSDIEEVGSRCCHAGRALPGYVSINYPISCSFELLWELLPFRLRTSVSKNSRFSRLQTRNYAKRYSPRFSRAFCPEHGFRNKERPLDAQRRSFRFEDKEGSWLRSHLASILPEMAKTSLTSLMGEHPRCQWGHRRWLGCSGSPRGPARCPSLVAPPARTRDPDLSAPTSPQHSASPDADRQTFTQWHKSLRIVCCIFISQCDIVSSVVSPKLRNFWGSSGNYNYESPKSLDFSVLVRSGPTFWFVRVPPLTWHVEQAALNNRLPRPSWSWRGER